MDHIYGDSGVNVNILTRALQIATNDNSPAPSVDVNLAKADTTFKPVASPVRDDLVAGRDTLDGNGSGQQDQQNIIFGDHGEVLQFVADPNLPDVPFGPLLQKIQTTELASVLAINALELQNGGDDTIYGTNIADILIGGAGNDMIDGREGDDLIFGDNVRLSRMGGAYDSSLLDDIASLRFQTLYGNLLYSRTDRQAESMAGGYVPPDGTLVGVTQYTSGVLLTDGIARAYRDPNGPQWWAEYSISYADLHTFAMDSGDVGVGSFGNDYIAGGAGHDQIFGQLGHDVIQGDGAIDSAVAATAHVGAARTGGDASDPIGALKVVASTDSLATDGQDYIEGGGGCDVIFGNLGQDDLVGGSSSFFSLTDAGSRPDDNDIIFGGSGTQISRNNALNSDGSLSDSGDASKRHAEDADTIVGDNGNIVRIVGINHADVNDVNTAKPNYLTFNYDTYAGQKLVVRGVSLLDYTPGGPDFKPDDFYLPTGEPGEVLPTDTLRQEFGLYARDDIGGHDEVHGETGDDTVYLGGGADIAFGDAEDDDIIGGWGADFISGGTGEDGVIGDDGRIFTSRNTADNTKAESLFGVQALLGSDPDSRTSQGNVLNEYIYTPGAVQTETINIGGELKKSVDITPYLLVPVGDVASQDPLTVQLDAPLFADDIIFGGLGDDFLHGGAGNDAISGAEALTVSYTVRFGSEVNTGQLEQQETAVAGLVRVDYTRPWNPGNILYFGDDTNPWNSPKPIVPRLGEFFLYDEYDPRRLILFHSDGTVWDEGNPLPAGGQITDLKQYFLNFAEDEGVKVGGYTQFNPNGTPVTSSWQLRESDGKDAIFGDLGNDWIVGGTGRDHLYGGWGNDLLNADDIMGGRNVLVDSAGARTYSTTYDTSAGLNNLPDSHVSYEDRAFGGAGLDILIGNTGGDRLIDWVGEYNSYIVPFAPFGIATVSRQVPPQLYDFLYAQAYSDGADITRTSDTGDANGTDRYSNVNKLMGGVHSEVGIITQQDHGYWQDQTGGPTDPQPGNIPGGRRDVLRTSDFNSGTTDAMLADEGNFAVSSGKLKASATSGTTQAAAVYNLDAYLPVYYEVRAQISADKPTGTWKANAYIIFDYQSPTDFKYAGINISTNKIEMGYRDASGWHQVVQSNKPVLLKAGISYDMLVAVNGTNVTVSVAGVNWFSYTFAPRIVDGEAVPLNQGLVGFGNNGSRGTVDNFTVQVLPPDWTLSHTESFSAPVTGVFNGETTTGSWTVAGDRVSVTAATGSNALNLASLGDQIATDAIVEIETRLKTNGIAGIAFDVYDQDDFKFVAVDDVANRVIVGHFTARDGWAIDRSFTKDIATNTDVTLKLVTSGSSVNVYLNGGFVGTHSFSAALVDGDLGLLARSASASFDSFTIRTNDRNFTNWTQPTAPALMAESVADRATGQRVTEEQAQALLEEALRRLGTVLDVSGLIGVDIRVEDLAGEQLGQYADGVVVIDSDAAGHGWFIDRSPGDDSEYELLDGILLASNGVAVGRVDLLSVIAHELGHAAGLVHLDAGVMSDTLATGTRTLAALVSVEPPIAPVDLMRHEPEILSSLPAAPRIDWAHIHTDTAPKILVATPAKAPAWQSDFVNHLARTEAQRNPNANLRVQINLAPKVSADLSALHSIV